MSGLHDTPPERVFALHRIRDRFKGTAIGAQRERLRAALQELGHVTTYEASRYLDLYDPRARKMELVKAGEDVVTTWRHAVTESGDKHRIGVYSMARGAAAAAL